jgi:hypothetical protein
MPSPAATMAPTTAMPAAAVSTPCMATESSTGMCYTATPGPSLAIILSVPAATIAITKEIEVGPTAVVAVVSSVIAITSAVATIHIANASCHAG